MEKRDVSSVIEGLKPSLKKLKLKGCKSSRISGITALNLDKEGKGSKVLMVVEFRKNKQRYIYHDVPLEDYQVLLNIEDTGGSLGKAFPDIVKDILYEKL